MAARKSRRNQTEYQRFHGNYEIITETGCWIWLLSPTFYGYGVFCINNIRHRAHRYSWFMHYGEIPNGMMVCHSCDIPACVNPSHLFLGSQRENILDMISKGRQRPSNIRGIKAYNAKLTDEKVLEIIKSKEKPIFFAEKFGISKTLVYRIRSGVAWEHLPR